MANLLCKSWYFVLLPNPFSLVIEYCFQLQEISENAMAEKERLSNSTWRSYRSGGGIIISVRGSDGKSKVTMQVGLGSITFQSHS